MTTTEDARTWARRIVEETLVEAGLVAPSETTRALPEDDGPPPPPSLARQAAHRIVESVQREHAAASASRARPTAPTIDGAEPPKGGDTGGDGTEVTRTEPDVAEEVRDGHNGSRSDDSEAANRARRIVAEVLAAEEARRAAAEAEEVEQARRAAEEVEQARRAAEEVERARRAEEEVERAKRAAEEARRAEEAEEARRAEEAEEARRAEEAAAEETSELSVAPGATVELPTEPIPDTRRDVAPDADRGGDLEPEAETEPGAALPAMPPTASVDLLPEEPARPSPSRQTAPGSHEPPNDPPAALDGDHHEAPAPGGPAVEGPPPPPLAFVDGWWQRIRARYRRRQAMAQWAPDAARPPRRTGRWLLVTIVAVAAIALLFPLAVDALRQLVAL